MNPTDLWKADQVFIEIGTENADTADALRTHGFENYLGLCNTPLRAESLDAARDDLEYRFLYTDDKRAIRRNNAQVLMLSGPASTNVWQYRHLRHVQQVAWRAEFSLWTLLGLVGWLWNWLAGRYALPRVATLRRPGAYTQRFFVARLKHPRPRGPKSQHYVPHRLGIRGMFAEINSRDLSYVVLRGWERLPQLDTVFGLAVLVTDEGWPEVIEMLDTAPGIEPCQVHGQQLGECCPPSQLVQQIIDNAVRHRGLCPVPNKRDYFHSLAFHAVYHLGTKSKLPVEGSRRLKLNGAASDYPSRLRKLADEMGIGVEISLTGLHHYLMRNGWHPTENELDRLTQGHRHKWLKPLVDGIDMAAEPETHELRRAA